MEVDPTWYQKAFGEDYLHRYAHRDEEEARQGCALALRSTGMRPGARVLDLCCGAGRHLLCLDVEGMEVVGGDLSMPLLRQVKQKLPAAKLARLDMRQLPFAPNSFDLVTNFFTAFGYFQEDDENLSVIQEVSRILAPGGFFFLDFLNALKAKNRLQQDTGTDRMMEATDGSKWSIKRSLSENGKRADKIQERLDSDGSEGERITESIRLFSRQELEEGMRRAGLVPVQAYGDYAGSPFEVDESERCVVVGNKPPISSS